MLLPFVESLWRDVRTSARRLATAPLFAAFAVVSVGTGLGVTTSVYAVIDSFLWPSDSIPAPETVVVVARSNGAGALGPALMSDHDFDEFQRSQASLSRVAGTIHVSHTVTGPAGSEVLRGEAVVADYFGVVGQLPLAGRGLHAADTQPGAAPVAVLHRRLAATWFGSAEDAVDRQIEIGDVSFTIVGVAPDRFDGFGRVLGTWSAYWIPREHTSTASHGPAVDERSRAVFAFGRLRSDATLAQATAEFAALAAGFDRTLPERAAEGSAAAGRPWLRDWQAASLADAVAASDDQSTRVGLVIVCLVAIVLLVACLNLASLTLARGMARIPEIAVRYSLGASRYRLVREQIVESGLIMAAGCFLAFVAIRVLLQAFTISLPMGNGPDVWLEPRLDGRVVLMSAGMILGAFLAFGLAPAIRLTRRPLVSLQSRDTVVGLAPGGGLWRLVRWQVAAAVTLFLVASVTFRVVAESARHDSGIALDRLAMATVEFDRLQRTDTLGWREAVESFVERARQLDDAEAVAATTTMPFGMWGTPIARYTPVETPFVDGREYAAARVLIATPSIFRTLGVPLVRGRGFDGRDEGRGLLPVVVSEVVSRETFGTTDVEGRRLLVRPWDGESTFEAHIVGVARDTDVHFLGSRGAGLIYLPLDAATTPAVTRAVALVARTGGPPGPLADRLRGAIQQGAPGIGITRSGTARWLLATDHVVLRFVAIGATALGFVALILAMAGLYGVLSQSVACRTREMAVRVALGATPTRVRRLALSQGIGFVLSGLLLGTALGTLARAAIRATIEPVPVIDWAALALIPIPVLLAAGLACLLPAARAARVEPTEALRDS